MPLQFGHLVRPLRAGGDPEDAFGLVERSAAPFP
jgi:hypothetical protein